MIDLLQKKLELIKQLHLVTKNIINLDIEDNEEKYLELIDERQSLMTKVDEISTKLKSCEKDTSELAAKLRNNINIYLTDIISLDKQIRNKIQKEIKDSKTKYYEADKKLQTSDYDIDEEDKKPAGYFLNMKG